MKTMFLQVLDWGRLIVPSLESGRLAWRWLAGHWIPAVSPSFETHTTRPILLHSGHFAWSPMLTMFCFPLRLSVYVKFRQRTSFSTYKWLARMICIFCSFLLNPFLIHAILFASCLLNLKRSNYSIGAAQRIREALHIEVWLRINKCMLRKAFRKPVKKSHSMR